MSYTKSSQTFKLFLSGEEAPPTTPTTPGIQPTLKTLEVFFWDNEEFFESPATSTRTLKFTNLVSAVLKINVSFKGLWWQNTEFNGANIAASTRDTVDVTNKIKEGTNTVRLHFVPTLALIGLASGVATVSIAMTMKVTQAQLEDLATDTEVKNKKPVALDIKTIAILAAVGVAAVGGLILVSSFRKGGIERAIEQMSQFELLKSFKK